ncbi:hypothetical protein HYV22_00030 [Candidatus Gottesmanbacteria bacterium]|nr:hypothetical protein [Candidatus Gottesmanbacteria bacterium]
MNFCMSGEYGIFKPDGSVPITLGHDFSREDIQPSSSIGSWRVEGNTLIITNTNISDATYRDFVFEKKGDTVVAYPEEGGCGLYVGPNTDILYEFTNTELVTSPGVDW